jgi:hypothetical protein
VQLGEGCAASGGLSEIEIDYVRQAIEEIEHLCTEKKS